MTFRWETIQSDGKEMRAYVGVPQGHGPLPAVVVAHHGPGLDEPMHDVLHCLYREGYAVILPDLFHRQTGEPEMMERIRMLRDEEIIADMNAAVSHLKDRSGEIKSFGVTGFCMGGRVTYLMAAANPEFAAAAVFYGGGILTSWGSGPSPYERSSDIQCPIIGFFGEKDSNPSPQDVGKISAELTRLGKWHEFHSYKEAGHGFRNFLSPERYNPRAAGASWQELLAFFSEYLKR